MNLQPIFRRTVELEVISSNRRINAVRPAGIQSGIVILGGMGILSSHVRILSSDVGAVIESLTILRAELVAEEEALKKAPAPPPTPEVTPNGFVKTHNNATNVTTYTKQPWLKKGDYVSEAIRSKYEAAGHKFTPEGFLLNDVATRPRELDVYPVPGQTLAEALNEAHEDADGGRHIPA